MTSRTGQAEDRQDLVRFLEESFACAQACTDCAHVCARRLSAVAPGEPAAARDLRRQAVLCTEVCDATCAMLAEQPGPAVRTAAFGQPQESGRPRLDGGARNDEYALRIQVEWCRAMCLESAHVCDRYAGAEDCAQACRRCARACTDFLAMLR